jgi:hypothetical protein
MKSESLKFLAILPPIIEIKRTPVWIKIYRKIPFFAYSLYSSGGLLYLSVIGRNDFSFGRAIGLKDLKISHLKYRKPMPISKVIQPHNTINPPSSVF